MVLRAAWLAFAGLALAPSSTAQQRPQCYAPERCRLKHADAASGAVTRIDLSPLCRAQGTYQFNGSGTSGQTFFFNVCGNTSQACSDYQNALTGAEYESWGHAVAAARAWRQPFRLPGGRQCHGVHGLHLWRAHVLLPAALRGGGGALLQAGAAGPRQRRHWRRGAHHRGLARQPHQ